MVKILFMIHDLGHGGAEKVLVNLVNHLNRSKFDITVIALFGGGVNEKFLLPDICYKTIFPKIIPGNRRWLKIFSPSLLHKLFVRDKYDIEVSFLEGVTARIISGCRTENTKLISWIHVEQKTKQVFSQSFRSYDEARSCYGKFDKIICVSNSVLKDFTALYGYQKSSEVLYNVIESDRVFQMSQEPQNKLLDDGSFRIVAVGTLKQSKGYDRILRVAEVLKNQDYPVHFYFLGEGPLQKNIEDYIESHQLESVVTLLGYDSNPYKYVANCDLFICASHAEGFSTAATEALIVGTPVCTVDVSGMKEMLGEHNEYGVVTENDEDALYRGIKSLLDDSALLAHYREKAAERGKTFDTDATVTAVEEMLLSLQEKEN